MDVQIVNELIGVLEQEARVYDGMLKISKNKTSIIVEGKVAELENIVKLEQSLVLQMGRLEAMREQFVDKLSSQMNIKPSDITISELMKYAEGGQVKKLKECQESMLSAVNELKNTNDLNSKLIKNSLEYIDFSLNLLANTNPSNNNYGSTGQTNDPKKRSFFDVKL